MSCELFFAAELELGSDAAVARAKARWHAEGYADHDDNVLSWDDLTIRGTRVSVRWDGSAPASCFDVTGGALAVLADHAVSGEAVALHLDALYGEIFRVGTGDDDEDADVEGDEVRALCERFGGTPLG